MLTGLHRVHSQKVLPLLTARMSAVFMRNQVHRLTWKIVSLLSPGLAASRTWTEDFVEFASKQRPECEYEELPGVGGCMFDNYSRKVLYASKVTVEKHGYMLHMTNSASMIVPKLLVPANFDANVLCEYQYALCYAL